MKRATVTIPDDVAPALEAYLEGQRPTHPLTAPPWAASPRSAGRARSIVERREPPIVLAG